jgi:predicted secreted hydrolase
VSRKTLIILLGLALASCSPGGSPDRSQREAASFRAMALESPPAFERVTRPTTFKFPEDHGPHFDFQTEWWYYTGNLLAEDGEQFSYQLTIFRRGVSPDPIDRASNFAADQIYFAHFAIGAIDQAEHRASERFSRGALDLAGSSNDPFEVFLEDWRILALDGSGSEVRLTAEEPNMALDLVLKATKPVVVHGEAGISAKSSAPGNASYYLSFTRMQTSGRLRFDDRSLQVEGTSWFDHEWSTTALQEGVVGWDWYSLQLDNGQELMLYVLRREDGSVEPVSAGTLIRADGSTRHLALEDFSIQARSQWQSPESGAIYPNGWTLMIPEEEIHLEIAPTFDAQELHVSFTYWEGSVIVVGQANGIPVNGQGFVELTGYLESMAGVF